MLKLNNVDLLLALYTLTISFRLLLSVVAPVILSLNSEHMFSTSSSRLSVSQATGVLDSRVRKRFKGGAFFLGDLLGLRASGCGATLCTRFGICDGVTDTPGFVREAVLGVASLRLIWLIAVLKEISRMDLPHCSLLSQSEL